MSRLRHSRACILLLPVVFALSCSRPGSLQTADSPQAGQSQVPFDGSGQRGQAKLSQTDSSVATHDPAVVEGAPPFRNPLNLPAGTLVTVRLAKPISADELGTNGPFDAILDDAVVVDGVTIIPRGAGAAGLVESARTSRLKHDRGYVRLTLESIDVAGRKLPVQTSSLFAKGGPAESPSSGKPDSADVVFLNKGRRLTFRLAGPLVLARQQEILTH